MEKREWNFLDKSAWGPGEWSREPDKVQFTDEATGLPCLAVRNLEFGSWCGYVGVAEGHPLYGVEYGQCADEFEVHGGLTFSDGCEERPDEHGICHIPSPGEPDTVHWFGFDCAHALDLSPGMSRLRRLAGIPARNYERYETYRSLEYVKAQCRSLAAQLAQYAKTHAGEPTP